MDVKIIETKIGNDPRVYFTLENVENNERVKIDKYVTYFLVYNDLFELICKMDNITLTTQRRKVYQ